ncbi:MarR family transcriptional regulator [Jiella sp. MQZ9-1]|uniref:MarR family transcriptional regulator n=1 Tax=Jiella flava TaxID=2816857 RepID=A0A939JXR1_9HYPH|nr:MarR family transcriptional regulator [Jiella flava]MBO0664357.1 MarR family transcriptional regulator [Jiella flava]MCD2472993.1 MarR family transcriptional regulator [Jiella flava]
MPRKRKKGLVTGHLVLAARHARTALLHDLGTAEIYPGQDSVLVVIGKNDGITLRDLAEKLAVRPPTVTKTIARLTTQGLVEKRVSETDLRQSRAFLTVEGAAIVERVQNAQKSLERRALAGFTERERKAFRRYLIRLQTNLAALDADEIGAPGAND